MRLEELTEYDPIMVQCHDNPDADAIAAGFGQAGQTDLRRQK